MFPKILIIIPAYNEAENIERVVDELIQNYPQYDYLIVNDGSKDNTKEICDKRKYHVLNLPVNLGLAGAVQTGYQYAYEYGYEYALQFDGDGQHQPCYIDKMLQAIKEHDIVIGSRFLKEAKPKSLRMMGSNVIEWVIRLTTHTTIKDPTSGMRLINRRMIKQFAYNMNYGPEPDTVSYLIRCGAKVEEIPVTMQERMAGESYLNLKRSILYMFRMCTSIILIQKFRKRVVL